VSPGQCVRAHTGHLGTLDSGKRADVIAMIRWPSWSFFDAPPSGAGDPEWPDRPGSTLKLGGMGLIGGLVEVLMICCKGSCEGVSSNGDFG
jgi:hypothetical protein